NLSKGQCEKGWKSLGLKCYYFSSFKLTWTQSRDYCVAKGGHLVIITSQTEQDFVVSKIGETHWIGLNDLETEGQWMWVNNQALKETGITFWYSAPEGPNEPDNWKEEDPSGENCAALGDGNGNMHKWFDASCRSIKKCICEKRLDQCSGTTRMSAPDPITELVEALRRALIPAPAAASTAVTFASAASSASPPVIASPVAIPAPFSGSAGDCNGFLLQCSLVLELICTLTIGQRWLS
ncbi:hypothetical protein QTP70_018385, partial [Hemibagrus guttatus]